MWQILFEHQFVYNRFHQAAGCLGCDLIETHVPDDRETLRRIQADHQAELVQDFMINDGWTKA